MGSVPSRQPKRERRQGTPRGGRRADDSHPSVRLTLDGQVARNQSTGPSLADGCVHRLIFFFFSFLQQNYLPFIHFLSFSGEADKSRGQSPAVSTVLALRKMAH